ncbi:MAG: stage III sporulation protein AB [Candidatus Scatovivens sp.]
MIILKCTCLILIFIISSKIGFIKAKSFRTRVDELTKIESALNFFKTKILYTNETIGNIFFQISKVIYNDESNIFLGTIDKPQKQDIYENWSFCLNDNKYLRNDDKQILNIFGKSLGKLDKNGQLSQIDESISLIKKQINIAEKEKEKNEKLYKSLGSIIGAIIVIILI